MLKLAGVLVVGMSIDDVLGELFDIMQLAMYTDEWFINSESSSKLEELMALGYALLTSLSPLLAGLYLIFGGEWLVRRIAPANRSFCEHCGYQLTGAAHARCPECGTALPAGPTGTNSIDDE